MSYDREHEDRIRMITAIIRGNFSLVSTEALARIHDDLLKAGMLKERGSFLPEEIDTSAAAVPALEMASHIADLHNRIRFPKDRNDPATWVLLLLSHRQISVGKAGEWLRNYIALGVHDPLPSNETDDGVPAILVEGGAA